jgi:hypothetical protein
MTLFFQKKSLNVRVKSMPSVAKIRLPIVLTPINLTLLAAVVTFFTIIFRESNSMGKNLVWIVSTKHVLIIALAFTALFFGLLLPRKKIDRMKAYDIHSLLKPGRNLTILGIIAHVIFIGFHLTGITQPSPNGKLGTIEGVTTLTQLLPVGLTTLYAINKAEKFSKKDRYLFSSGLILILLRVFLNSERLALIEIVFPICLVYLSFKKFGRKNRLRELFYFYSLLIFSAVAYFAFFEYFRSWQIRKYSWSGNYLSYASERLASYYSTSLNNGAIYYEYRDLFSKFPSVTLDFVIQMPILKQLFFSENTSNYTWGQVLTSVSNTSEFNNAGVMLTLAKDLSLFGAVVFLFFVGRIYKLFVNRINSGDLYSLIVFATTAIAFIELPRLQWWTLGRTFPIYLGLIYLYTSKNVSEKRELK